MKSKKNSEKTLSEKVNLKKQENKLKETLELNSNATVVIENKSKISVVLRVLSNIFTFLLKALLVVIIVLLSTIGATVLFNDSLRDTFFNLIKVNF